MAEPFGGIYGTNPSWPSGWGQPPSWWSSPEVRREKPWSNAGPLVEVSPGVYRLAEDIEPQKTSFTPFGTDTRSSYGITTRSYNPPLGQGTGKRPFGSEPFAYSNVGPLYSPAEGVYLPKEDIAPWFQRYYKTLGEASAMPIPNLPGGVPFQQYKPEKLRSPEYFRELQKQYPDLYEPGELPVEPFVAPPKITKDDVKRNLGIGIAPTSLTPPGTITAPAAEGTPRATTNAEILAQRYGIRQGQSFMAPEATPPPGTTPVTPPPPPGEMPTDLESILKLLLGPEEGGQAGTNFPIIPEGVKPGEILEDANGYQWRIEQDNAGNYIYKPVGHSSTAPAMPLAKVGTKVGIQARQEAARLAQQAREALEKLQYPDIELPPDIAKALGRDTVPARQFATFMTLYNNILLSQQRDLTNKIRDEDRKEREAREAEEKRRWQLQLDFDLQKYADNINAQNYAKAYQQWRDKYDIEQARQARVRSERQSYEDYLLRAQGLGQEAFRTGVAAQTERNRAQESALNFAMAQRRQELEESLMPFRVMGAQKKPAFRPFYQR